MSTPSTETFSTPASAARRRASFLEARLASALAIFPLGVWLFVHLWHNLAAYEGGAAWQIAVTEYPHPFAEGIVWCIVLVPLGIHTIWGVGRLATSRPNNARYRYYANFKYLLQRIAALGLFFFLGAHLWLAMLRPRLVERRAEPFADIAHEMRFHTPTLVVYLLGILGAAYHLANGAQTFCMAWGVVTTQRGLRRLESLALALFVLLLAMGWGAVYALWAAGGGRP